MISHEELKFLINLHYPDAEHGVDFWVAHPVKENSAEQVAQAFIAEWRIEGTEAPDEEVVNLLEATYAQELEDYRAVEAKRLRLPNLSPRQLWLMALDVGITKDQLLAKLDTLPDQYEAAQLRIELTEAPMYGYERYSPTVEALREIEGISEQQFDDLWAWAAGK